MINNTMKIKLYFILLIILFAVFLFFTTSFTYRKIKADAIEDAKSVAEQVFLKDKLYRNWSAKHGGVYVPVTKDTQPNKYLSHVKDRDVYKADGTMLTLINPAYMTRQVYEIAKGTDVIQTHLTSKRYFNPLNRPDRWEEHALDVLEQGVKEYSSVDYIKGKPYLRFMRPFMTTEGCLKCHGYQGYKVGDIRGGISVEIPLESLEQEEKEVAGFLVGGNIIVFMSGLLILSFVYYKMKGIYATENSLRKDKETILTELNHRVKNNMQLIYGILELHIMSAHDGETKDILNELKNRLMSMSTMHNMLDFTKDVTSVSTEKYINDLIDFFSNAYLDKNEFKINIVKEIDDFELNAKQAVSCGLIINELVTNSFKYAFDDNSVNPTITIGCRRTGTHVSLYVYDNGKGVENKSFMEKDDSYGLMLVESMATQLEASLKIDGKDGMKTRLLFRA